MAYFLIHRFGPSDKPQFRKEPFSTEPEAVIRACGQLAGGAAGEFVVENEKGETVANDVEIRSRCKSTRMP
jgi:hypothetical protein